MAEKNRILVVDDESSLRAALSAQLRGQGYSVSSAGDGAIAIEMMRLEYFDLILLDIKMPHFDGYHVLSYVKKKYPTTKVIMLTGFADLKNALDSMGLGADHIVGKPYELSNLLSAIQGVLGNA
jgi:DNA-binding response OmpR family regulator